MLSQKGNSNVPTWPTFSRNLGQDLMLENAKIAGGRLRRLAGWEPIFGVIASFAFQVYRVHIFDKIFWTRGLFNVTQYSAASAVRE